jgi:hypothetical protein
MGILMESHEQSLEPCIAVASVASDEFDRRKTLIGAIGFSFCLDQVWGDMDSRSFSRP